ncbi:MAG: glycosyltransferase family 2 protein [Acholeplasmatales bacterium]|nr:glycosyltransferase [Acholeplasmatales bacterium]MDD7395095.1 glycosyltransferase family 2 protein [Acholeplasmatales bacterium]MDY4016558.1 glycosyltransferase family 2 protein [Bacilli bacterium]HCX08193.1 hypothetical protein [Acholeplasmatales bacterium]
MDLVSVIVPTYKRDSSLVRALESLENQTYKNIEVVVVNDCVEETWKEYVENTIQKFIDNGILKIVFIQNQVNLGSAKTRNVGIENASGKYITFLDDDDVYLPDKILNQVTKMQEQDADYSVTNLEQYDEDTNKFIEKRTRDYIDENQLDKLLVWHYMYHITCTDTFMFKKTYLLQIGSFSSIDVGDEFYLMEKAILGNGKFLYVNDCSVKTYIHRSTNGVSSGIGKIKGENELYAYKKQRFNEFKKSSIHYIKTRHYLTIAFAYYRMKKIFKTLWYSFRAFIISPIAFFKILRNR